MLAPAQWLVQLISFLPAAIRPGIFVAALLAIVWFVFVKRGIPLLWRWACRGVAVVVYIAVGVALFPEYLRTTARERHGVEPGAVAQAATPVAEYVLDAASGLYRYGIPIKDDKPTTSKRFPWGWCTLVVVACTVAWIAMEQMSRAEEAKHTFAQAFEYWRDVEAWAKVDPSRRAAPGDPGTPHVVRVHYVPGAVHVEVGCPGENTCVGTLDIRTRSGTTLASAPMEIESEHTEILRLPLPGEPPNAARRLRATIDIS